MALKKAESKLYQRIKKHIKDAHFQRIETSTIQGVPDINYCIEGVEGWIELKVSRGKLSRFQKVWIYTRLKHGGRVFILVSVPRERALKLFKPKPSTRDPLSDPPIRVLREPINWQNLKNFLKNL